MTKISYPRTKSLLQRLFNIRAWIDFDRLIEFLKSLQHLLYIWFIPRKRITPCPDFEKILAAQNLTEADLANKKRALSRLSMFMLYMAILCFLYAMYQWARGHILSCILSIVIMLIALALSFRYHFWKFQIEQRRLGCSGLDWIRQGLLRITR